MVKHEYYTKRNDGVVLVKTYSTTNHYIKQVETGYEYDVAIDVATLKDGAYVPLKYTYVETDKEIEKEEEKGYEDNPR